LQRVLQKLRVISTEGTPLVGRSGEICFEGRPLHCALRASVEVTRDGSISAFDGLYILVRLFSRADTLIFSQELQKILMMGSEGI